ncbi:MAG: O-antigen ligase family protein [Nitrospirae bacterium]|nr:O-antigen ligase family protein [Nitrospirota bacterium]
MMNTIRNSWRSADLLSGASSMRAGLFVLLVSALATLAATLIIGYLTLEPFTGAFIIAAGISVAAIAALVLINVKSAIPLLMIFAPITSVFWFKFKVYTGGRPFIANFLMIDVVAIVVFVCYLLYSSTVKGKTYSYVAKAYQGNLNILLFLFTGWIFLSVLWSPSTICSLYASALFIMHSLIYFTLAALIKTERDLNTVVKTMFALAVVISVTMLISIVPIKSLDIRKMYLVADWLALKVTFNGNSMRAAGLTNEKTASEFIGLSILVSMALFSHTRDKKRRLLLACLIVISGFAFLFAQSKSAATGLLAGLLLLSFALNKTRAYFIRNLFRFFSVFILMFAIFLTAQAGLLSLRNINKEQSLPTIYASKSQVQDALSSRLKWWNNCYNKMAARDAYLYGLGIGGCGYYIRLPGGEPGFVGTEVANPHSTYLSIFFDLGIIGSLLFLSLVLLSAIRVYRLMKKLRDGLEKDMLTALLCGAMITGMLAVTEVSYYQSVSIWVLAGIAVAAFRIIVSKQAEAEEHGKT